MNNLIRYPKTHHILGSKECDVDLLPKDLLNNNFVSLEEMKKEGNVIIEEKMDGMGVGIFFKNSKTYIQFHAQVLEEENCPKEFKNIFVWIENNKDLLFSIIKEEQIIFGEWMEFKHCVFYNALPSYFIEYDIYDINKEIFLDTPTRKNIINQANLNRDNSLISAHVIHQNNIKTYHELINLLKLKVAFGKNSHVVRDFEQSLKYQKNSDKLKKETLLDLYPEGFYIKVEKDGAVVDRYKFIRKSFMEKILSSTHWKDTSLMKNNLELL